MEAVPKLPLISFDLKTSPENTHFGPKLKQYIAEAYREDPESYTNETHQMECLRSVAVRPTMDEEGLSGLNKYFCQLRSLQSRFPMAKGQPAACSFSWRDLYANMTCALPDIRFEMACILYNIGALHSYLGASEPRTSADSLKAACTHYQNAAWAFQYLKEQYPQPPGVDVSTEIMRLLQKICFAQAQECILEKSIQDTRKPSVIGAVATQVFLFYKNALAVLGPSAGTDNIHEIIGTRLYNFFHRFLSFKSAYIGCIVCLYQGMNAEEQQKMGERVAFYQQAVERLADARKLAKYIDPVQVTQEALTFTNDVVEGKRKAAKNENEFIYHEEVPEKDQLVEMKPVCLVKPLPINFNDPEISGPDVFARLVPICAHEASSMYSEEKAKILRHIVTQAESKNMELTEFMSSLQLDQLEVIDSDQKIPQEIVDRCAAMNAKSEIIQTLVDSMNSLAEIISDVEHSLSEVKTLIQEEAMKEKEYQKSMGPRPPSIVQTELSREYHKYHEAHTRTNESNQVLHKAMTLHIANLKLLSQPLEELQSKIPSIDNIEGLDRETMAEMRRVVGKAREMQAQRDSLIQNLREDITNDDITSQLLARSTEPAEDIFKQELEKHTPKVKIIEQNLVAQENIINKLTSLYAAYGESRRLLTDVLRKREGLINALITSYEAYEELLAKSQKGLEFYKKLLHNVNQLLTRLKGTCQVQEEERSQLLAKNTKPSSPTPQPIEVNVVVQPGGAPLKLKDYLPYMKNRTSRSGTPQAVEAMPADTYYPESIYPTSIRPAPVGSEASDLQMQLPDGVIMPQMQPNQYDRYATPYAPENDPYAAQHNYAYPATSKYDKPEENYGYSSSYTPQQFSAHMSDPSQQSYSNPYYAAAHNNTTVVTDSQGPTQYPNPQNSNQFANNSTQMPNQGNMTPNQYPNMNQPNQPSMNPNQYQYDPYSQSQANPANPIPDVVPPYNQANLNSSFSQMHVSTPKSEPAANFGQDYTQTYFNVQYPQATTPNYATYTPSMNTSSNTNMVSSLTPSDYSSLNYPYSSDSATNGQNHNVSNPNEGTSKMDNPNVNNHNMGYPNVMGNPNTSNHSYSSDSNQYGQMVNPNLANPNMSNPNISNPNMSNPNMTNPNLTNPNIANQTMANPNTPNPNLTNPNMNNLNMNNPNMAGNPNMASPNLTNPNMANPNINNPHMANSNMAIPHMVNSQMINQNMPNPNMTNPNIGNPSQTNPNISKPNIGNPSIGNPNMDNTNLSNPNTVNPYSSDTSQYGHTNIPNAAIPYQTSDQYIASSSHSNLSQGYATYTNPESIVSSTTTITPGTQNFAEEQTYPSPALSHIDDFDQPIKSHVTGQALSTRNYKPTYVNYGVQNVPTSQMQSTSQETYPTNAYGYPDQSNASYSQGYQNHPGYTFNSTSGGYDYSYGSQNAYTTNTYDANHGNTNLQQMDKGSNPPAHGVYTSAGSYGTLQSPSETPQGQDQTAAGNTQIYYNTPYGYITNTNQAQEMMQNPQSMSTNYGAHVNQSTYMQSGKGNNTNTTNTNYQVPTPTENVGEPDFEQTPQSNGYNETQSNQSLSNQPSNAGHNVHNYESTNPAYNVNVGSAQNQPVDQSNNAAQTQNPEPTNQNTPIYQNTENHKPVESDIIKEEKSKNIPETKAELSAFDLLLDIDFTVETKTLMPEIKVPQISESAIKKPMPRPEPVKRPVIKEEVIERPAKRDLFSDPSLMNQFTQEVKSLQRLTETLTNKAGAGLTVLDSKWKAFQDLQNKENMTRSKTLAMQHTTGNIVTEVVPYNDSRLTLKSDPDAYINASYYKQLAPWCIPLVISKTPSEDEYSIFWKAVLENKISCVVCLLSEIEMQGKSYWPTAKGQSLALSNLRVTLDEVTCTVHWTERKLTVSSGKTVLGVTHYQINVFPAKIVCSPLVLLVDKILSVTYESRLSNQLCGAWVQCAAGAGRSALVALLCALMCQVRAGQLPLCDMLDESCRNLCMHRSNVLEDTKYLADAYRTALFYVQGVLCSGTTSFNGEAVTSATCASILPPATPTPASSLPKQKFSRESFEEMKQSPGLKSGDMKDPLNFLDPLWSLKKK